MRARTALAACSVAAAGYAACADQEDPSELERSDADVGTVDARVPDGALDVPQVDPDASGGPVAFCEAFKAMRTCRCCHYAEPPNGIGPFRLFTYEDTQQDYFGEPVYVRMRTALETDFMPLVDPCDDDGACVIDPPAKPLEPRCKQTLLDWIDQGAQPVGGTNCEPDAFCQADIGCVPQRP